MLTCLGKFFPYINSLTASTAKQLSLPKGINTTVLSDQLRHYGVQDIEDRLYTAEGGRVNWEVIRRLVRSQDGFRRVYEEARWELPAVLVPIIYGQHVAVTMPFFNFYVSANGEKNFPELKKTFVECRLKGNTTIESIRIKLRPHIERLVDSTVMQVGYIDLVFGKMSSIITQYNLWKVFNNCNCKEAEAPRKYYFIPILWNIFILNFY